jgi:hypothetical protein
MLTDYCVPAPDNQGQPRRTPRPLSTADSEPMTGYMEVERTLADFTVPIRCPSFRNAPFFGPIGRA